MRTYFLFWKQSSWYTVVNIDIKQIKLFDSQLIQAGKKDTWCWCQKQQQFCSESFALDHIIMLKWYKWHFYISDYLCKHYFAGKMVGPSLHTQVSKKLVVHYWDLRYWLFQLLPLPSTKFWNFKSVRTRLKFCRNFLKSPKEKVNVNKMQWKWTKSKYNTL